MCVIVYSEVITCSRIESMDKIWLTSTQNNNYNCGDENVQFFFCVLFVTVVSPFHNVYTVHICVYMQFTRYLRMYDPDAGIKVVPCHRYSTETCGAKIIVTKEWYHFLYVCIL